MRITATRGVIHGAEGVTPPLPWVTVNRAEGAKLVRAGHAIEVQGGDDAKAEDDLDLAYVLSVDATENDFVVLDMIAADARYAPWFTAYVASRLPEILAKHAPAASATPAADTAPAKPGRKAKAKAEAAPPPVDAERAQHIADALDLIDEEHLETDGDRAGKPKLDAIAEITGFPVTAEEIDAALALKDTAA